ncbi:MAG: polysaccharide deacetylase family protein [Nitrospirae bacterium]|nr:polysaccharide deacetylase family protein [Nitrospirota bacterium]
MKWKRVIAEGISEGLFFIKGHQNYQKGLRILLYHSIDAKLPHDSYGISVKKEVFTRQMAALRGMEDICIVSLNNRHVSDTALQIAITFDDGYKDNLYTAAPILLKYRIPFTVFVSTAFIQKKVPFYLTPQELKELSSVDGVTIGSHGVNHIPLAECGDSALWKELRESKNYLEDITGKPITAVSYPYGSVNRRVRDTAAKAGYIIGGCSMFGINKASRDALLLYRTEMIASDSEKVFLQKLYGAWDWYKWGQKALTAI